MEAWSSTNSMDESPVSTDVFRSCLLCRLHLRIFFSSMRSWYRGQNQQGGSWADKFHVKDNEVWLNVKLRGVHENSKFTWFFMWKTHEQYNYIYIYTRTLMRQCSTLLCDIVQGSNSREPIVEQDQVKRPIREMPYQPIQILLPPLLHIRAGPRQVWSLFELCHLVRTCYPRWQDQTGQSTGSSHLEKQKVNRWNPIKSSITCS